MSGIVSLVGGRPGIVLDSTVHHDIVPGVVLGSVVDPVVGGGPDIEVVQTPVYSLYPWNVRRNRPLVRFGLVVVGSGLCSMARVPVLLCLLPVAGHASLSGKVPLVCVGKVPLSSLGLEALFLWVVLCWTILLSVVLVVPGCTGILFGVFPRLDLCW